MYELEGMKILTLFESLAYSAATALGTMKPEAPTRPVTEIDEQGQVVDSRPYPVTLVTPLMKRKEAVFVASAF